MDFLTDFSQLCHMRRHSFATATLKKDAENVAKKKKESAKASGSKSETKSSNKTK